MLPCFVQKRIAKQKDSPKRELIRCAFSQPKVPTSEDDGAGAAAAADDSSGLNHSPPFG